MRTPQNKLSAYPALQRSFVRRNQFEDLHGHFPKLNAERLQPGVKKSFTGAVGREIGEEYEGQPAEVVMIVEFG